MRELEPRELRDVKARWAGPIISTSPVPDPDAGRRSSGRPAPPRRQKSFHVERDDGSGVNDLDVNGSRHWWRKSSFSVPLSPRQEDRSINQRTIPAPLAPARRATRGSLRSAPHRDLLRLYDSSAREGCRCLDAFLLRHSGWQPCRLCHTHRARAPASRERCFGCETRTNPCRRQQRLPLSHLPISTSNLLDSRLYGARVTPPQESAIRDCHREEREDPASPVIDLLISACQLAGQERVALLDPEKLNKLSSSQGRVNPHACRDSSRPLSHSTKLTLKLLKPSKIGQGSAMEPTVQLLFLRNRPVLPPWLCGEPRGSLDTGP